MINIYWNTAHDGNVNHSEEIPHLGLIPFGRLHHYLISAETWFNLMKLGRHPSNILSPGVKHTVIPRPLLGQRTASRSLKVCRRAAVAVGLGRRARRRRGLSPGWLIKADIWMEMSKVAGLLSVITKPPPPPPLSSSQCWSRAQSVPLNLRQQVWQPKHLYSHRLRNVPVESNLGRCFPLLHRVRPV